MDSDYKRRMAPAIPLLVLAALTPDRHHVTVADENVRPLRYDDRPDLVGITVNVDTANRAYGIASRYRNLGVPVILGGIHASANPHEALMHGDSVCIGEAEDLWEGILADAGNGVLRRRYFNPTPTDMAKTPIPAWGKLDRSQYLYTNVVVASRGCPFQCDFCYNSNGHVHHYRNRPVANVLAEITHLQSRQIMFVDDNLIGNIDWTRKLIAAINPLGITWHAAVSANLGAHPDLMDAMARSGCRSLFIGFESINSASVHSVNKRQNDTARYERLIGDLHARGIMVNASMAFGFDHDGQDVFDSTVAWLTANKVETMTAHILTPYPGTTLYEQLDAQGRIIDRDWSRYNTSHVVFQPKQMSPEQLREGYLRAYREFYSFKSILKRLPDDPRRRAPYLLFNLCYRKFGSLTARLARFGLMRSVGALLRRLSYGIG